MKKFIIVTDSGSDLNLDLATSLGIVQLPFEVRFGDDIFFDRETLTPDEFYNKLSNFAGIPQTALVTPGTFKKVFEHALTIAEEVLYIGFSSGISGTFQAAVLAKSMVNSDAITLIDSGGASSGQSILIMKAIELIEQCATKIEIITTLKYMIEKTKYYFAVGNLEMLYRGGRLSTSAAIMGTVLNIKPILTFDNGHIESFEKVRGNKAMLKMMLNMMSTESKDISAQVVGIAYSGTDDSLALQLKDAISKEFGVNNFLVSQMGAAIGSHVGSGTVGVCFLTK